ncbi:MAG: PaaI family thioesterase [Acidimicrobiia bacterium]
MSIDEARLAAAAALRDLNHAFVAHHADEAQLRELAELASRERVALRAGERRDRLALMKAAAAAAAASATPDQTNAFPPATPGSGFSDRAVAGTTNPTSIEIDVTYEGDDVVGRFVLGSAFEGAPGRAHGGIVAAAFDDVTGFVIGQLREPAFTGELTVRFVRPVPVREPLELRARLDGRERRKLLISAEARAGDEIVATCHAIYITVDPSIFAGSPDPR